MKKYITIIVIIVLVGIGAYFLMRSPATAPSIKESPSFTPTPTETGINGQTNGTSGEMQANEPTSVIGKSIQGNDLIAYHYGSGAKELLFIGGIHGGYEWNTVLVAYNLMDYLEKTPSAIPASVNVTVIPVLNPDGLNKIVGTAGRFTTAAVPASESATIPGRFNANNVDLNRNFDCDWQAVGTWQNKSVSGGSAVFSEPESKAIRDYVIAHTPTAVVVWYSAAGGVFASNCHNGVLPETKTITAAYAKASGYPAYQSFDFYQLTGDMVNWFAKNNIPAISVLLSTHKDVEWDKNWAGIEALLQRYAK